MLMPYTSILTAGVPCTVPPALTQSHLRYGSLLPPTICIATVYGNEHADGQLGDVAAAAAPGRMIILCSKGLTDIVRWQDSLCRKVTTETHPLRILLAVQPGKSSMYFCP